MNLFNIFLTADLADDFDDFEHGSARFVFDRLGPEGPKRLVEGPSWMFIDWVLDDLAGLEMCRRLRADSRYAEAHITMVLDSDDVEERRRALKAGADDYIVGPLDRTIVLDRVMALQSADKRKSTRQVSIGSLTIDLASLRATWLDTPIDLRPNEFRLLRFFAENADRVLSRDDLISGVGKQEPPIDERTVDVWIGRLRRALKEAGAGNPLRTIRSYGYVFDSD